MLQSDTRPGSPTGAETGARTSVTRSFAPPLLQARTRSLRSPQRPTAAIDPSPEASEPRLGANHDIPMLLATIAGVVGLFFVGITQ